MSKIVCSGALFYALDTKRFLFLHRANGKTSGTWGLVGGGNELGESPFEGLTREIQEEVGDLPKFVKTIPLETFVSNDEKFNFHTYLVVVKKEFLPNLNNEHDGYAWTSFGKWPKTLHQGLRNTLQNKTNLSKLETVFQVIDLLEE
jgi:8-oxo-dGTP pyrophosphatase MutT (NUDIX family)